MAYMGIPGLMPRTVRMELYYHKAGFGVLVNRMHSPAYLLGLACNGVPSGKGAEAGDSGYRMTNIGID